MINAGSAPVWFRLPPGFHDVHPSDRDALDSFADALNSSAAQQELARLMDALHDLANLQVVHTALGLHPDEQGDVATSVFAMAVRPAETDNLRLTVARTALAISQSTLWSPTTRRLIDLPSGLPCYLVAGTISVPTAEQQLFQAKVVMPHADGNHLLALDLTSAETRYGDAYIDILEAIAHTVSFTDPDPDPVPTATSRILEVLL
ncbi:hypothetical protein [Streptomyces sp. NPDC058612]|uniref:hypothetical protein n=1 Tax=Streptomyces sp. NPDC058612 TaxID=3346555 RepID=UPI00365835BA